MSGGAGVLIVGASAAGVSAARELRRGGYAGPVTLLGAEARAPYRRPPLSKELLVDGVADAALALRLDAELGVRLEAGRTAAGLDPAARAVTCADGAVYPYNGLVIATGAAPVHPWRDTAPAGVHLLRTLDDARALRGALSTARRVAVIGAGFIGAEVAAAARRLGRDVTLIDALPTPHAAVLGPEIGTLCAGLHRDHGVALRLGATVAGIDGADTGRPGQGPEGAGADGNGRTGRVTSVRLANAPPVPADLVVVGTGVRPATGWLDGSGVALDDGVVCDERCAVLDEAGRVIDGVVAAGDVARWRHPGGTMRVEHWDNAVAQGRAAARTLLGAAEPYAPVPYFWSDQYDTKIQVVGVPRPDDAVTVVAGRTDERRFAAVYGRAGRVTAALAMNLPRALGRCRDLVRSGAAYPPDGL